MSKHFFRKGQYSGFTLIELLAVVGIAALLISVASSAFFGVSRKEAANRGKKQLRDVIVSAQQDATISGHPTIVFCWNSSRNQQIGNQTIQVKQGHYALFKYLGRAWPDGSKRLGSPFGIEREAFNGLSAPLPVFNLNDLDGNPKPMKVVRVKQSNYVEKKEENDSYSIKEFEIPIYVGGSDTGDKLIVGGSDENAIEMGCLALDEPMPGSGNEPYFPLAVRVSANNSLPEGFIFSGDKRQVVIFNADGGASESKTITIENTADANDRFTLNVKTNGDISITQ